MRWGQRSLWSVNIRCFLPGVSLAQEVAPKAALASLRKGDSVSVQSYALLHPITYDSFHMSARFRSHTFEHRVHLPRMPFISCVHEKFLFILQNPVLLFTCAGLKDTGENAVSTSRHTVLGMMVSTFQKSNLGSRS